MEPEPEHCCFDDWAAGNAKRARRKEITAGVTRDLVEALGPSRLAGRTVLDLGCGTGDLALATLARGATRATGVDLGSGAIEHARALARERMVQDRSTFQVGDAAKMRSRSARRRPPQPGPVLLPAGRRVAGELPAGGTPRVRVHGSAVIGDRRDASPGSRRGSPTSSSGSATGSSGASACTCTISRRSIAGCARPGSDRSSKVVAGWCGNSRSTSGPRDLSIAWRCVRLSLVETSLRTDDVRVARVEGKRVGMLQLSLGDLLDLELPHPHHLPCGRFRRRSPDG